MKSAIFYPSLSVVLDSEIYGRRTAATQDLGAACAEMRHFVDHDFLSSLPNGNYLVQSIVPSHPPCSEMMGTKNPLGPETVLGMLPEPLVVHCKALDENGAFNSSSDYSVRLELTSALVVHKLPVPLHISVKALTEDFMPQATRNAAWQLPCCLTSRDSKPMRAEEFDVSYQQHPYWGRTDRLQLGITSLPWILGITSLEEYDTMRGALVEAQKVNIRDQIRAARSRGVGDAIVGAEAERLAGNEAIGVGRNRDAVDSYSKAMMLLWPFGTKPTVVWPIVMCLSNRAEAHLRLNDYSAAATDCSTALSLLERYDRDFDEEEYGHNAKEIKGKTERRERRAVVAIAKARAREEAERAQQARADDARVAEAREAELLASQERNAQARAAADAAAARARELTQREQAEREVQEERRAREAAAAERQLQQATRLREEAERQAEERRAAEEAAAARRAERERVQERRRAERQARAQRRERETREAEEQEAAREEAEREWRERTIREAEERQAQAAADERLRRETDYLMDLRHREMVEDQRRGLQEISRRRTEATTASDVNASCGVASSSADSISAVDETKRECSICLCGEEEGELYLACGFHPLHHACAFMWGEKERGQGRAPTCPECRRDI